MNYLNVVYAIETTNNNNKNNNNNTQRRKRTMQCRMTEHMSVGGQRLHIYAIVKEGSYYYYYYSSVPCYSKRCEFSSFKNSK